MLRETVSAGMARRRLPLGNAPFLQDLHFILPHHPLLLALILALLHLKHLWQRRTAAERAQLLARAKGDVERGGWGPGRGREARPRVQECEREHVWWCVCVCVCVCCVCEGGMP